MAQIFDRETLLDLTVNAVPLAIILIFVGLFVFTEPFPGLDRLGFLITLGLHVMPFVALALLTYVSGKAIAGDEHREEVFFQGQATIDNAPTREEARASRDRHVSQEAREDEPPEESVQDDESATAEQEEEPAEHRATEDVTAEPAPPKDVDVGAEEGDETTDADTAETLDEQVDSAGAGSDPDESAAELGEKSEGTVQDEATEATERREGASETREGESDPETDPKAAGDGSDQTDETATGGGEAPTEADETAAPDDDETDDDSRAE